MPRNIDQIATSFISNLKLVNSPLTDFSPSSVNLALIRSIAALQLEQDILLDNLNTTSNLSTSTGIYLDNKVKDFGIVRKTSNYATGYILVKTAFLALNSILTDINTNNQYTVVSSPSLANKFGEVSYLIKSISTGSKYNLEANSKLLYLQNPNINIIVGQYRLDNLDIVGDIKGGADTETDSLLLNRFVSTLLDSRYSTSSFIKSFILNQSNITFVYIDNPFPGHLTIWFESSVVFTNSDINNLNQLIEDQVPAGVTFDVLVIQRQFITINLLINNSIKNKDDVSTKLTEDVNSWFDQLKINESFDPQLLLTYLNSVNFSFLPSITLKDNPGIITCLPDNLISLGSLLFTFNNA